MCHDCSVLKRLIKLIQLIFLRINNGGGPVIVKGFLLALFFETGGCQQNRQAFVVLDLLGNRVCLLLQRDFLTDWSLVLIL